MEREAGKREVRAMPLERLTLLPHFYSTFSFRLVGNHGRGRARIRNKENKLEGEKTVGGGGAWCLGEVLAANLAISVKQNAEGK